MRKEADFEVMDHIRISVANNEKVAQIVQKNEQTIKEDVLADEVILGQANGYTKEWNINGEQVVLGVEKL